jgi:MtN3 and saliva related transmembrane protein
LKSTDWVAYAAGLLTTYAFWPQVVRVWRTKQTRDLSLGMYIIFSTGVGLWILYGWLQDLYTVMVPNVVTLMLSSFILYRIVRGRA